VHGDGFFPKNNKKRSQVNHFAADDSFMRLLSFLSEIENALSSGTVNPGESKWTAARMVNFHQKLARLTLKPTSSSDNELPSGEIFVQTFSLANDAVCLKASLNWDHSVASPVISVYSNSLTNWQQEASQIAAKWREGAPKESATREDSQETVVGYPRHAQTRSFASAGASGLEQPASLQAAVS